MIIIKITPNSFTVFSQDSIAVKDVTEDKELQFQQFFFKALSEKSIRNYKKAIENLENCNSLIEDDTSVLFELSKNYFFLEKTYESKQYLDKALQQDPENIWMLEHLVAIHDKDQNFKEAITVQKKIIEQNPKKKTPLVYLYLKNRDYSSALELMDELEQEYGLNKNLQDLRSSLNARKNPKRKKEENSDIASVIDAFENNRASFQQFQKLISVSKKEDASVFEKYSQQGVDFFPAQPMAYLFKAQFLSSKKQFEDSNDILEMGLDFLVENAEIEKLFYQQFLENYQNLGDTKKANEYKQKLNKLGA